MRLHSILALLVCGFLNTSCTNAQGGQPRSVARGVAPMATPMAKDTQPAPTLSIPAKAANGDAVPDENWVNLQRVYQKAVQSYSGIDSYICRLKRREQVNGKDQPEDVLLFKFRKQPFSAYFKWLSNPGLGREVTYVQGRYKGDIHTLLAEGDHPLMPAGKRLSLQPDNIFVRTKSRHTIQEAGIGNTIERLGLVFEQIAQGKRDPATMKYLGLAKRPEFSDVQLETVALSIAPGREPALPKGGSRWIFFDPQTGLPTLIITHDEKDHEVEYYCYDRVQFPVKLDEDDFNPDKLWGPKK